MSPRSPQGPAIGERAPGFRLRGIDNAYWILGEPDARRTVLLVFLTRESSTSRLLLPFVERLMRRAKRRESEILAITRDRLRDAMELSEDFSFTLPILIDEDGGTFRAYGIVEVPTLIRLDAGLRVVERITGWDRGAFEGLATRFLEAAEARATHVWEDADLAPQTAPAQPAPPPAQPAPSP
ncbi:MAG: redoxin domain-containing protein, partial [Candidatus Eisenbacteria bacterium]|nr:redoxin domain-containing protein [Candidatus Eisenbacteria bacterium]